MTRLSLKISCTSQASLIMCVYNPTLKHRLLQQWVKYFISIGCMIFSWLILDEFGTFPNICLLVASKYLCMTDYPLKFKTFLLIQDGSFPHNVMIMKL